MNPDEGGAGQAFYCEHGSYSSVSPHVTSPLRVFLPLQGPTLLLCPTHAEVTAVAIVKRKEVSRLLHNTCLKYNRFGNNKFFLPKQTNGVDLKVQF